MAWDDYSASDLAADKPPTASIAAWIAERDDILFTLPFRLELTEATTTAASWATMHSSILIYVPDFAGLGLAAGQGAYLNFQPEAYVSSGTGDFRMVLETGGFTYGTTIAVTATGGYGTEPSGPTKINIPYDQVNAEITFRTQAQTTGGVTLYLRNSDRLTAWWSVS